MPLWIAIPLAIAGYLAVGMLGFIWVFLDHWYPSDGNPVGYALTWPIWAPVKLVKYLIKASGNIIKGIKSSLKIFE